MIIKNKQYNKRVEILKIINNKWIIMKYIFIVFLLEIKKAIIIFLEKMRKR